MGKSVTLAINGKSVCVPEGTTVFQAAKVAGIAIPHYCYHPDLSIAGVCRMCMVEIEKFPKPQISCNTVATEAMIVRTDTPMIQQTVKGVLELHLINHPLDCPICDKAGECKLQDSYRKYGLYSSRMDVPKVHKPKAQDIGPIMLDSERCILCTRCVRFTAEVTRTNELGIFNRGDRSELKTYDGGPLQNDYTGNLADICPVGALTAKDFRFQCRVWFLEKTDSVCAMCAQGCNTTVSVNPSTKKLYRVEPRRNVEVNKSWICDTGRWGFHSVYENRIATPLRKASQWAETTWEESFSMIKQAIVSHRTLVLLSTQLTNEEAVDTIQTLQGLGAGDFSWLVDEKIVNDSEPFDGILKYRDKTANAKGIDWVFENLKVAQPGLDALTQQISSGAFGCILVVGLEGGSVEYWAGVAGSIHARTELFVHATNHHPTFERATCVLPNVSGFEKTGTFMNAQKRLQRCSAALAAQGLARNAHELVWGIVQGNDRVICPKQRAYSVFDASIKTWFSPTVQLSTFSKEGLSL